MDYRCTYSSFQGVAVTGSTGFVGRTLIHSYGTGDFISLPLDEVPAGSVLIHLAADVSDTPQALMNNLSMDRHLVEQASKNHAALIYASSNNVYPFARDCRIEDRTYCHDNYAASKIFGEKLVVDLARVPAVSLRIADVFGPGQRHGNFFTAVERALRTSTPLQRYGMALKRRTYIHVHELCNIIKFLADGAVAQSTCQTVVNVGYYDHASVSQIIDAVSAQSGLDVEEINVAPDTSALDLRTMHITPIPGYTPIWDSFQAALNAYVEETQS